ncbi:MAG: hypothetical protein M1833_000665 [Piccolia ochrophora]|nr:MAG: hypothetical protein M1833_000665 [Piccolia ochrophora]
MSLSRSKRDRSSQGQMRQVNDSDRRSASKPTRYPSQTSHGEAQTASYRSICRTSDTYDDGPEAGQRAPPYDRAQRTTPRSSADPSSSGAQPSMTFHPSDAVPFREPAPSSGFHPPVLERDTRGTSGVPMGLPAYEEYSYAMSAPADSPRTSSDTHGSQRPSTVKGQAKRLMKRLGGDHEARPRRLERASSEHLARSYC